MPFLQRYWWVVAIVLVVFGLITAGTLGAFNNVARAKPHGRILVGSPSIYTRERLVNDRSEEEEWLRNQLKMTDSLVFAVQGAVARLTRKQLALKAAVGSAQTQAGESDSNDAKFADAGVYDTQLAEAPLDIFHDRTAYRDEVRAELIENQLDDRHDLDGNTVYRFNFDLSVIPAAQNAAYAIVTVKLTRYDQNGNSDDPKDKGLYADWLRQILADAKATFHKREQDAWAALVASEASPQTPPVQPPTPVGSPAPAKPGKISQDVVDDLTAVRDDLLISYGKRDKDKDKDKDKEPCPESDATGDVPVMKTLSCLIDRLVDMAGAGLKKTPQTREAKFSERFATLFAKKMAERYGALASFAVDGGELVLNNLSGTPFDDGYARYKQTVVKASTVYAYAVNPKESFDRLSQRALEGDDVSSALSAAAPGDVPTSAAVSARRLKEVSANAIERTPRIVGFNGVANAAAYFGWLVGPQFHPLNQDQIFEQQPSHNVVSAIVSAPSWWTKAHVSITAYWYDQARNLCFGEQLDAKKCPDPSEAEQDSALGHWDYDVQLPVDPRPLNDILLADGSIRDADSLKQPTIDKDKMETVRVEVESKAEVVIPGRNLWRSPLVTLGGQQATRIKLLPNMNGLIAYFDSIAVPPGGISLKYEEPLLTVWTSQKNSDSVKGKVQLYPKPQPPSAASAALVAPRPAPAPKLAAK